MANMIELTDFSAPELDVYARLTEAQLRSKREPEKGMFIAESSKVIERALNAGYEPVSFLMERRHIDVGHPAWVEAARNTWESIQNRSLCAADNKFI